MFKLALAVLLCVIGCGESKPKRPPRFLFKAWSKNVIVEVDGKRVPLEPSGYDGTFGGLIDMPAGTDAAKVKVSVRRPSPCGPGNIEDLDRRPPNEANVIVIEIPRRDTPKDMMDVVVAPGVKGVQVGPETIPDGTTKMRLYAPNCSFTVKVGTESITMPARTTDQRTLLVGAGPAKCYRAGVVGFAAPGKSCAADTVNEFRGALAYWLEPWISYPFESVPTTIKTYKTDCEYHGFIADC